MANRSTLQIALPGGAVLCSSGARSIAGGVIYIRFAQSATSYLAQFDEFVRDPRAAMERLLSALATSLEHEREDGGFFFSLPDGSILRGWSDHCVQFLDEHGDSSGCWALEDWGDPDAGDLALCAILSQLASCCSAITAAEPAQAV